MNTPCRTSTGSNSPTGKSAMRPSTTNNGGGPPRSGGGGTPGTLLLALAGKLFRKSSTLRAAEAEVACTNPMKASALKNATSLPARERNCKVGWVATISAHRMAPKLLLQFPRKSTLRSGIGPGGTPSAGPFGIAPPTASAMTMLPSSCRKLSQSSMLVSLCRCGKLQAIASAPRKPTLLELRLRCTMLEPALMRAPNSISIPASPRLLWFKLR
mmetsp:Transcript_16958/g.39521  ORF Transcript_16958/g.39521 Transcript_16958/m.39521 type:complete len:214 (-) Transcript_16958:4667-5308(-)